MSRASLVGALIWALGGCAGATSDSASPSGAPEPAEGKRAPCTLGADQTCNDDPSASALWGRCTELGVCECHEGFELNPAGRCQKAGAS